MKISIFGAGPIGLATSVALSTWGHEILCIDTNTNLIESLSQGHTDLYEADLKVQLNKALDQKKIKFTQTIEEAILFSHIYIICIGTPSSNNGQCNLNAIYDCIDQIVQFNTKDTPIKTIILKSTVPPNTNLTLKQKYFRQNHIYFVSNPEFLREGCALHDTLNPDRIIVGCNDSKTLELMEKIYETPLKNHGVKFLKMDPVSAEISKYAANIFLASRISLMNEMSVLAEIYNANIKDISNVVGTDHRIGPYFLNSGLGFGGSCFPKDIRATLYLAQEKNIQLPITQAIQRMNEIQHDRFSEMILQNMTEKVITLWGISFKPATNDIREASALKVIQKLLDSHFKIHIHDPELSLEFSTRYSCEINENKIHIYKDKYDSLINSYGLALCTEWPEYIDSDIVRIKNILKSPLFFDGRNIFNPHQMKNIGLKYFSLGQS